MGWLEAGVIEIITNSAPTLELKLSLAKKLDLHDLGVILQIHHDFVSIGRWSEREQIIVYRLGKH